MVEVRLVRVDRGGAVVGGVRHAVAVRVGSRDGEEARAKLEEVGVPVLKTSIRRFVAFQKAALQGVPVYQVNDPNAQEGWEEYQQVGRELLYEVTDKSAQ